MEPFIAPVWSENGGLFCGADPGSATSASMAGLSAGPMPRLPEREVVSAGG